MASHLLFGKESFLKREFIQGLRVRQLGASSNAAMNFQEFSGKRNDIFLALDFVSTAPFLSESRIAVLWEADSLPKDSKDSLLAAIPRLPTTATLILVSEESNTKKNEFLRELSTLCQTVACHAPFDRDLPKWIERRAKSIGKSIHVEAITSLLERSGKDLATLASSLEALGVYSGSQKEILVQHVQEFLGRSAEEDVFRLTDVLLQHQLVRALEILHSLFIEGAKSFEILAGLSSQFERLKKALEMQGRGHTIQEIGTRLGVHPFYQEKFKSQLASVSSERVENMLQKLLFYDEAIKTGRLAEKLAVETLVLTITSSRTGS